MSKKKREKVFESMEQEVIFLRRQNASLRGLNGALVKETQRYKNLDIEGDHLYEKSIAMNENLQDMVKEKEKKIETLQLEITTLRETINEKNDIISNIKGDVAVAEANLEHYINLPWYKKIFAK